ncbi:hypothetical protein PMIN03_007948 [Paraphaeosphaeria minitans]
MTVSTCGDEGRLLLQYTVATVLTSLAATACASKRKVQHRDDDNVVILATARAQHSKRRAKTGLCREHR